MKYIRKKLTKKKEKERENEKRNKKKKLKYDNEKMGCEERKNI